MLFKYDQCTLRVPLERKKPTGFGEVFLNPVKDKF